MVLNNEDAMNKIPLKSSNGLDDEEKNGGEFICDTDAAEEARREQMRANILVWMKKLTIVLICFIGLALISYLVISLCFSDNNSNKNESPGMEAITTLATNNATSDADKHSNDIINKAGFASNHNHDTTRPEIQKTLPVQDDKNDDNDGAGAGDGDGDAVAIPVGIGAGVATTVAPVVDGATFAASTIAEANKQTENGNEKAHNEAEGNGKEAEVGEGTGAGKGENEGKPKMKFNWKDVPITTDKFNSILGVYQNAAVCSDKQICSEIGSKILEEGGSAVDSAIATLLCNGVTTSQSMGIGGGMLMNVYLKDSQRAYSIDAREVAPFGSTEDMFNQNPNASMYGGLSIAVPGELMGYAKAHERFGKLPWSKIIEPSIQICEDGFHISKHMHYSLKLTWNNIRNNEILKETFVNKTSGELYPAGTKIKPPKTLCQTYKTLAANGPLDFYNGSLSKLVSADLKDIGSLVTRDDLEAYSADMVSSITMELGDDILYALPPISSGTVVSHILSILEGFNFTKDDLADPVKQAQTIHRFTEAIKFGFAKRSDLGDLRFIDSRELISKLTNPEFGSEVRSQINDTHVLKDVIAYGAQSVGTEDSGTSHTVVLAPNGDAVSVTSTVNFYFGSGHIGSRTGIVFNSAMSDFSIPTASNFFGLPPAQSNFIEDRKRPMSSMSPMILATKDGDVKMLVGAAGGTKIISAVVEVMARYLWFGQNIKEAIDAPRFHHQLIPNILEYEHGKFNEEVLKHLQAKGHVLKPYNNIGSVVCGIVRNGTGIYANADYRKQGGTAGF